MKRTDDIENEVTDRVLDWQLRYGPFINIHTIERIRDDVCLKQATKKKGY